MDAPVDLTEEAEPKAEEKAEESSESSADNSVARWTSTANLIETYNN